MKEAFKRFIDNHPFLSFFGGITIISSIVNLVVGIVQAITGNYPPAPTYSNTNDDAEDSNEPEIEQSEEVAEPTEETSEA